MPRIKISKDGKGREYHEGYPIIRLQKNGLFEVLCPAGHLIAYDVSPECLDYYRKPVRCYGTL